MSRKKIELHNDYHDEECADVSESVPIENIASKRWEPDYLAQFRYFHTAFPRQTSVSSSQDLTATQCAQ